MIGVSGCMQHFSYENLLRRNEIFFKEPESFTKFSDKEILSYALGATLYMPAIKEHIAANIIEKKYTERTSMVIDLEDAVGDFQLEDAEQNLYMEIETLFLALEENRLTYDELPLIFIRVRNPEQMKRVTERLGLKQIVLTGYVFPKFLPDIGREYLEILKENNSSSLILYGMPILETSQIIYKESRLETLLAIKSLVDEYSKYILNIRIGATDFCGLFGIRRKANTTIYDVAIIQDCLSDILNIFNRRDQGYVISGPVWEFFSKDARILKPTLRMTPFQEKYGKVGLQLRNQMLNEYLDGLINEVLLDKMNGLIGKTIIHPTHIAPVHSLYVVTHEEYLDALAVINNSEGQVGVIKSVYENKMNEMKPHLYWASRILMRARLFGVFNEEQDFTSLIVEEQQINEVLEVN